MPPRSPRSREAGMVGLEAEASRGPVGRVARTKAAKGEPREHPNRRAARIPLPWGNLGAVGYHVAQSGSQAPDPTNPVALGPA